MNFIWLSVVINLILFFFVETYPVLPVNTSYPTRRVEIISRRIIDTGCQRGYISIRGQCRRTHDSDNRL